MARKGGREFDVYRPGGDLESAIKAAVTDFKRRLGRLPRSLVVHNSAADAARRIVGGGMTVVACSGCLVGELWLEKAEVCRG